MMTMSMMSAQAELARLGDKPAPCPDHSRARTGRPFQAGCPACQAVRRWDVATRNVRVPIGPVREHLERLTGAGLTAADIARLAGRRTVTVTWILTTEFFDVSYVAARDILRVPVPDDEVADEPAAPPPAGATRRRPGLGATMVHIDTVRAHLAVLTKGMTLRQIATRSEQSLETVRKLNAPNPKQNKVRARVAHAILAVTPLPDEAPPPPTAWVPATASRRRLEGLLADGFPMPMICAALQRSEVRVRHWLNSTQMRPPTVLLIAELAERWKNRRGPDPESGRAARAAGMLPRRYWTDDNIGKSRYKPQAPMRDPWRVRRRLQTLAFAGFGETFVARVTGEDPADVLRWTRNERADIPRYVLPVVDAVYQRYAMYVGPDDDAARHARAHGWGAASEWAVAVKGIDTAGATGRRGMKLPNRWPDETNPAVMFAAAGGGVRAVELTVPERRAVVLYLARRGATIAQIAALLQWAPNRAAGEHAVRAILTGLTDDDHKNADAIAEHASDAARNRKTEHKPYTRRRRITVDAPSTPAGEPAELAAA